MEQARKGYSGYPDTAREALKLEGVYVALENRTTQNRYTLGVLLPSVDGTVYPRTHLNLKDLQFDPERPVVAIDEDLPNYRPDLTSVAVPPPGKAPTFDRDSRLSAVVTSGNPTAGAAIQTAAQVAGVDYLASSSYFMRRISSSAQPGQAPGRVTARQLLEAAARATGGTWRLVGKTYVLKPDPALERLGLLNPEFRQAFLQDEMARLARILTSKQLLLMRSGKSLRSTSLNSDQRRQLYRVACGGFATFDMIEPGITRLEGITLSLVEQTFNGTKRRTVLCTVPRTDGRTFRIASAPVQ